MSKPVLNATDLAATWASPDGGSITFTGDHRFTVNVFDKRGG